MRATLAMLLLVTGLRLIFAIFNAAERSQGMDE